MAEIKLYDGVEIMHDDWYGDWEQPYYIGMGPLAASVIVPLIDAVTDGEDIIVKINSVGGLVFDGWAIYNALIAAKLRGCKIIVRIEGLAASIASIIAMAGDDIIICLAAMLMIHKPTSDLWWCGSMDSDALKSEAETLDKIQAVLNSIYVDKTGLDSVTIDLMINAETWITPNEALTLGFVNSIEASTAGGAVAEKPVVTEDAFNHIFKNADPKTRAYANSTIKIRKNMDNKEALKKHTEATAKSNSLLDKILKKLNISSDEEETTVVNADSELADGTKIYYTGALAVGSEVFTDEALTVHIAEGSHELKDGNTITVDANGIVTELVVKDAEAENAAKDLVIENLKSDVSNLQTALDASTEALNKVNLKLEAIANVKSAYVPEPRKTVIEDKNNNTGKEADGKLDLSKEAREARRAEREDLNKNKTK